MDTLEWNIQILEQTLCDLAKAYRAVGSSRTLMAFDKERGQYLLLDEGWEGYRHIHTVWAHIEFRDDKFWIQEDGTEEGIANLLLSAGIPADRIVLGFDAPNLRSMTAFATT